MSHVQLPLRTPAGLSRRSLFTFLSLLTLVLLMGASAAEAQVYFRWRNPGTSGNWRVAGNWESSTTADFSAAVTSPATVFPNQAGSLTQIVTLPAGTYTVTVDAATTNNSVKTIEIGAGVTLSSAFNFTVAGNATYPQGIFGAGTLNHTANTVTIIDGPLNVNYTYANTPTVALTSTVVDITLPDNLNVFNLTINKSGRSITVGNSVMINGAFTATAGNILLNDRELTVVSMTGNAVVTFTTGTLTFLGNNGHGGTMTLGTGTVNYGRNDGLDQRIRGTTYYNLRISGSGTKTLAAPATVTNECELAGGTLNLADGATSRTLTMSGGVNPAFFTSSGGNLSGGAPGTPLGVIAITGANGGSAGTLTVGTANNHLATLTLSRNGNARGVPELRLRGNTQVSAINFSGAGADYFKFRIQNNSNLTVRSAAGTVGNANQNKHIVLGSINSTYTIMPSTGIGANASVTLPIGPDNEAETPFTGLAQGSGRINFVGNPPNTDVTLTSGDFADFTTQVAFFEPLRQSDGTRVGTVTNRGATSITLANDGTQGGPISNENFRISYVYKPVIIQPITAVDAGQTLTVGIRNYSGTGSVGTATYIPPTESRLGWFYSITGDADFSSVNLTLQANAKTDRGDYNNNVLTSRLGVFRYSGGNFWSKLGGNILADANLGNTPVQVPGISLVGTGSYTLGNPSVILLDDPTYEWVGGSGGNAWKVAANWKAPISAPTAWPDAFNHNVIITGGSGGPVLTTGDTIQVRSILHSARQITLATGSKLKISRNYTQNLSNAPGTYVPGNGFIQSSGGANNFLNGGVGAAATNFDVQVQPGSYILDRSDRTLLGIVAEVISASQVRLANLSNGGTQTQPPVLQTTYDIFTPSFSAGAGAITTDPTTNVITLSGGTATTAMLGRVLRTTTGEFIGVVTTILSPTIIKVLDEPMQTLSGEAYQMANSALPRSGSAMLSLAPGSEVVYNGIGMQNMVAAIYPRLTVEGSMTATDSYKNVLFAGETVRVQERFRATLNNKPGGLTGTQYIINSGAKIHYFYHSTTTALGFPFRSFESTGANGGGENVTFGAGGDGRVDLSLVHARPSHNFNLNGPEFRLLERLRDFDVEIKSVGSYIIIPTGGVVDVARAFRLLHPGGPSVTMQFGSSGGEPGLTGLTIRGTLEAATSIVFTRGTTTTPVGPRRPEVRVLGSGALGVDPVSQFNAGPFSTIMLSRPGATMSVGSANANAIDTVRVGAGTLTINASPITNVKTLVTGGTLVLAGAVYNNVPADPGDAGIIGTGGTINVTNVAGQVSLAGNVTAGALAALTATPGAQLIFSGANPATVVLPASGVTVGNITVNKSAPVTVTVTGGMLAYTGTISLPATNQGTLLTWATGNITLRSSGVSSATTARIGQALGGGYGGPNWTVERGFPAGAGSAGWYFVGTPVTGVQVQDVGGIAPRFTPINNSRNWFFDETDSSAVVFQNQKVGINGWRPMTPTQELTLGRGYRFWANSQFTLAGQAMSTTGAMSSGDKLVGLTRTPGQYNGGGWNLISNPYPSQIDWETGITKPGAGALNNAIYTWVGQTGNYQVFVGAGGSNIATTPIGVNGASRYIASGQAFFVKAFANTSITFTEATKTTTASTFYRTGQDEAPERQTLRLTLANGQNHTDEMALRLGHPEYTTGMDGAFDGTHWEGTNVNLSSVSEGGQTLAIDSRPMPDSREILPLRVKSRTTGRHELRIAGLETFAGVGVRFRLLDRSTGELTPLLNGAAITLNLTTQDNANPAGRYALVIERLSVTSPAAPVRGGIMSVYPNPAPRGRVMVTLAGTPQTPSRLAVYDLSGRLVHEQPALMGGARSIELDIASTLPAGVYQIKIWAGEGVYTDKLVIE